MLFLALRYIAWRRKQSILVTIGLALGTATFISISGMMLGMRGFILGQLVDNDGHVRISGRDEQITENSIDDVFYSDRPQVIQWKKPPLGRRGTLRISNPATWMTTLDQDSSVVGYSPQAIVQVGFRSGAITTFGKLIGCNPERQLEVTNIGQYMTRGDFKSLARGGNRIVLGDGLASKIGVSTDDSVLVSNGSAAPSVFKVSGIVHLGIRQLDDQTAYALVTDAQRLNGNPGVFTDISVRLVDPSMAAAEATGWQTLFSRETVLSWDQSNAGFLSVFRIQDAIRYFLSFAFLVVESFGIYNILSIMVTQKRKDIAILKSLGFGRKKVIRIFLLQGLILGLAGSLSGVVLGYLMCRGMQLVPIGGNAMYTAPGSHLLVAFPLPVYVASFLLTILAAILSAALPARTAGKLAPIDIIRTGE